MFYEYAYNNWCASFFQDICNIAYYLLVPLLVVCQFM